MFIPQNLFLFYKAHVDLIKHSFMFHVLSCMVSPQDNNWWNIQLHFLLNVLHPTEHWKQTKTSKTVLSRYCVVRSFSVHVRYLNSLQLYATNSTTRQKTCSRLEPIRSHICQEGGGVCVDSVISFLTSVSFSLSLSTFPSFCFGSALSSMSKAPTAAQTGRRLRCRTS